MCGILSLNFKYWFPLWPYHVENVRSTLSVYSTWSSWPRPPVYNETRCNSSQKMSVKRCLRPLKNHNCFVYNYNFGEAFFVLWSCFRMISIVKNLRKLQCYIWIELTLKPIEIFQQMVKTGCGKPLGRNYVRLLLLVQSDLLSQLNIIPEIYIWTLHLI